MSQIRILVVESEVQSRRFLTTTLELHGYSIKAAHDESSARALIAGWQPDLMLLDMELPTSDSLQIIAWVRTWSQLPIIALSAHGREDDKVAALTGGADDYVTKPFGTAELLARIQVALRHAAQCSSGHEAALTIGDLSVDLVTRRVTRQGDVLHLTPTEYSILRVLALQREHIVSHALLARAVWGTRAVEEVTKLRVFINQLRHKIEDDPSHPRYLVTETGVGYRLTAPEDVPTVV